MHDRRLRQRDVAVGIRPRGALALLTRRNVAVDLAAGTAHHPWRALPLALAAELTTTAAAGPPLRTTAIAAWVEIAARSARRTRYGRRAGVEWKAVGVALRLLAIEVDTLALRPRSLVLPAKVAFVLATEVALVLATKAALVRATEIALAPLFAGLTQADGVRVALRLHAVEIRPAATLALRPRLTWRSRSAAVRTRTTLTLRPWTTTLSRLARTALPMRTLLAPLTLRTLAALARLTRPTLAVTAAMLAMRTLATLSCAFAWNAAIGQRRAFRRDRTLRRNNGVNGHATFHHGRAINRRHVAVLT